MQSTIGDAGIKETTAELALADWLTEEFPVVPKPPPPRRRTAPRFALMAVVMLLIGLLAGLATAWVRGAADSSAAPQTGAASAAPASSGAALAPSLSSHDVIGTVTAVGTRSISVRSGSIISTYQVTAATRITRGTSVVRLQTLKVGEQVTIRLGFADSTSTVLTARAISVKAAVAKPRASARATPAPAPAVLTPGPQAEVSAPATVVVPSLPANAFGTGVGNRTFGGGLSPGARMAGGGFGGR